MTILLAIICVISVVQFGLIIYLAMELRYYSRTCKELIKIMKDQNNLIDDSGKLVNHNSNTISELIRALYELNKLVCEHDKKIDETNEWVTSVDDNIADMRKDIQKILEKFDDEDLQYFKGTLKRARGINTNSIWDSEDYSDLYKKIVSKMPPLDTHLDDQKGDEANEQT